MSRCVKSAVLVIGHGSRRAEANDDVREAARRIGQRGGFDLVEAAFLEIEQPNINEGFTRLVEHGACNIAVHPYFLSPGRHTRGDIPVAVQAAAARHAGISYHITEPLSAHRLVIEASVERINEATASLPAPPEYGKGIDRELNAEPGKHESFCVKAKRGTVYLVGAGPGDPGLLTLKASGLLSSCDLVIYDYLVSPEVLAYVADSAERIYAGKVGGGKQTSQAEINSLLISHALQGRRVVRLKGGDPFLFGRGAEEAQALRAAGIPFEVVPGISSALAAPAYAGIPLTHRDLSSSVAVLTGAHASDGALRRNLAAVSADTVVILMGMAHLKEIAEQLIAAGRPVDTPAAVIRWGTHDAQQIVVGSLRTIATAAELAGMRPPAVIVIGEVVQLRERLKWFEDSATGCGEEAFAAVTARTT
jgi:uroporphyrin-III C-methyltransferase